ncbi:hypothetical protein [Roseateles terrae]|uniref:Uncharacterized protein n=1 Tax=Roseateles terrae TaxID=431060 RepID=A0ABR6GKY6_9BURK|nr:hypothetical protein [Roseateles terrae]MBB3192727.1 hypothetical protein [Roseateles terrae]OWQ89992.1 hypothetical protein CDN98_05780 [Roseateles terrae]
MDSSVGSSVDPSLERFGNGHVDVDVDVDVDLRRLHLSSPVWATPGAFGPSKTWVPQSLPLQRLEMQDTARCLLSRARQEAYLRCRTLDARTHAEDLPGLRDAMQSRLWVVEQLMEQVPELVEDARTVGSGLRIFRTAQALMDAAERVLNGGYRHYPEAVRLNCLDGACYTRLASQLDPDFWDRVVRCDLLTPEQADAVVLQSCEHPYRDFQPRFSCWKDAPILPALDASAVRPVALETDQVSDIWESLGGHGVINAMTAARMLRHDRDSDAADVDAVVAQWMTLRPGSLHAVFIPNADILVLRTDSAAARQIFNGRPEHQQARYCPEVRRLFIGVKVTGETREVPAARRPPEGRHPPRFWLEHARMLVREGWKAPPETLIRVVRSIEPVEGESMEFTVGWNTGVLDLPEGGFLEALAAATSDQSLGFELGVSEEESHAIVVARFLLGQPLPEALRRYVARQMRWAGVVQETAL